MNAERERCLLSHLRGADLCQPIGRLSAIKGLLVESTVLDVSLGDLVSIRPSPNAPELIAEVVALQSQRLVLMPYGEVHGLSLKSHVLPCHSGFTVPVGNALLGRVLDARCLSLEGTELPPNLPRQALNSSPLNPLQREPIEHVLMTGVKAIDAFVPLGRGQRIGIFAGSGVGKSTLLGMICAHTEAEVIVIALIGERGREVGDFIRNSLGAEGLKRAVVIAAPAEQAAVLRRQAAYSATTIAEWFRAQGRHVLLIMDSITRFALAQREIGLATAEPIGSRGYPASVFARLPPLLERAGALKGQGSITAIYTVLVEGDDMNEPIADHMRAILDGHIVLDRHTAERGHYPAIDVLQSISRLAGTLRSTQQQRDIERIRRGLAAYKRCEDLIDLGVYEAGSQALLDTMITLKSQIKDFLCQSITASCPLAQTWQAIHHLASQLGELADHD